MFLKHMQLVGFKSFADKTKLDFEPGLITIVGPNGCGKSNVIDAFRWCLGEMSAKSLRSSLMLDVVFNGSGSRPAQNMAEVTLTFDNTDRRLPIDFSDVSISRRLFRSGESEYYINKTQCRLRDIRELFLDTGMGEDGYSSMEQGRVEWVLQAKPEQRRELFEEAAGVAKYRARREEAIRKLDKVEFDLSRINDIVAVTKDQIRKLENSVNRAKTYERIKKELKDMEIADWLSQIERIDEDIQKNKTELEESEKSLESLTTESHKTEAELIEKRQRLTETEEQLLEANSILSAIDADIKIGEERLTNTKQRETDLYNQIEAIKENILREEGRITELTAQEEKQQEAATQFKTGGEEIETDYKESKTLSDSAYQQLEEKREQIKQGRDLLMSKAQERASLQQNIAQLTSDASRYRSQAENAEKELTKIQEEGEKLKSDLNELEKQNSLLKSQLEEKTQTLETVTTEIESLKKAEQESQSDLINTSEEIAKLEGKIHSIEERQSKDPYMVGTKAVLDAKIPGIYGPIGRVFKCEDEDRDLISVSIGQHLGDLIADDMESARQAIDFLAASGKGRAQVWILDKLDESTLSSPPQMLGSTPLISKIQCEPKFQPLLQVLSSERWIDGATIYGKAIVNGGADASQVPAHITLRLPELQEKLAKDNEIKEEKEKTLAELKEKIHNETAKRESLVKEVEEVRIRTELSSEEQTKQKQKSDLNTEEIGIITNELAKLKDDEAQAQSLLQDEQKQLDQMQIDEKEDHNKLDILQQELTELQTRHSEANANFSLKQEQYNSYQEKLNWHESVLSHTKKDLESIKSNLESQHTNVTELTSEIDVAKKGQSEAQELINSSLEKRKGASEKVGTIQSVRVSLSEEIHQSEKNLNTVRANLNQVQELVQTKKLEDNNLRNKEEILNQKLLDQYEINLEQARQEYQPAAADQEQLEKLKKRVHNIGPINLAAPQEHAELVEKFDFLNSQQEDLLTAKDDLKQVIQKINTTTKEHFRETFESVRNNFRDLYSKLFRGGEADLQLTDEADILNSGVDIFCQPPGKKLLHISLLSGGEKALTACALLFAFFQVRPSPVCLLDEVDAPLDESNVIRFVEMVKKFAEKTQFIMITHNKRSMEAANNMYGVTMEELGVSKILSARLAKKETPEESPVATEAAPV